MRIAHVIDSLEVGGAEAVVVALCRLQAAAGEEVAVHCLFKGGALADELALEGFRVFVHGPGSSAKLAWRLYREFRRTNLDVVHCHNKTATVHAAPAAHASGVRAVFSTRHGIAAPPYRLRKDFKYWICAALFCRSVIAVCDLARHNMNENAGPLARRVVTIRNGAYPARLSGKGVVSRDQGFTIVTVGRLVPAKNYLGLLQSVALALREVRDLKLWIIGDGREADMLKNMAAELGITSAVRFFGEQSAVGDWLNSADLFVSSSISEGLPISILEAMAAGLPTIVTNVGGMPEVLELSGAGKVVPVENVPLLAQAIVEFASQREELSKLGQRARDCYLQYFRPERMAEDYLTLYRGFVPGDRAVI
jgi:glycosyltransferase involved in cell wall biosynthesis